MVQGWNESGLTGVRPKLRSSEERANRGVGENWSFQTGSIWKPVDRRRRTWTLIDELSWVSTQSSATAVFLVCPVLSPNSTIHVFISLNKQPSYLTILA